MGNKIHYLWWSIIHYRISNPRNYLRFDISGPLQISAVFYKKLHYEQYGVYEENSQKFMEEIWGTRQRGSHCTWKTCELLTFAARSIVLSNCRLIWIKTKSLGEVRGIPNAYGILREELYCVRDISFTHFMHCWLPYIVNFSNTVYFPLLCTPEGQFSVVVI